MRSMVERETRGAAEENAEPAVSSSSLSDPAEFTLGRALRATRGPGHLSLLERKFRFKEKGRRTEVRRPRFLQAFVGLRSRASHP